MMEWRSWIAQTLPRTEIMRGGATVWPSGADRLIGDTLGPVMHLHDGASEIFFFRGGRTRLEIGNSEEIFEKGDFVLFPPQVPHNFWSDSEEDLLVFWLVAPHFIENKWRTEGITAQEMGLRAVRAQIDPLLSSSSSEIQVHPLPSDDNIHSRLVGLPTGKHLEEFTSTRQEAVLYILGGPALVKAGKLGGILEEEEFIHIPANTHYSISAEDKPAWALVFKLQGF